MPVLWRLLVLVVTATVLLPLPAGAATQRPPAPAVQRLGETVLDPTARGNLTWAATANVASYQQDALVTEGAYQYTAWYAADRTAVVARRALPTGAWQSLRLDAVLFADDSHNNITLAVSPRDGRLHVALATHTGHVRYVRSVPGVSTGAAPWASTSFEPVAAQLPGAENAPRSWTYPTFERFGDDLLLTWRLGSAVRGRQALARYDPDRGGSWRYLGTFTGHGGEWSNTHGTSTSRYAYLHGFGRNPVSGDLEITWTWREQQVAQDPRCPEAPANRDLSYARSRDGGLTWLNDAGSVIGRTGTSDVITTDDVQVVVPIAVETGMINQESQAFDSAGRLHVITSQVDDATLASVGGCLTGDYYAGRAAYAHPVHHWRDGGGWHSAPIPIALDAGGRSQLVFDAADRAHLVLPDGRIAVAEADDGWSAWEVLFDGADVDSVSELSLDRFRMRRDGVLSVVRQGTGVPRHAPSPFSVTDFGPGGTTAIGAATSTSAPPPRAYAGSAPVWPAASATSRQPNFPARFAADGDPSSGWMSGRAVRSLVDGIEWVSLADAIEAVDGGASLAQPQILTIAYPSPRWVGRLTLDPGGLRGPRDWWARGRVDGRWVELARVSGQPQQVRTYAVPRTRIDTLQVFVTRGHHAPSVSVAEVRTADRVPSARMVIGTPSRQTRRASATLPVTVREQGSLRLFRGPGVQAETRFVASAGTVRLTVRPRGAAARRLSVRACRRSVTDRVSVVVRIKLRFTPTGGAPSVKTVAVRLTRTC